MGNMWAPDSPPPEPQFIPKYDPMLGFPNGRKERSMLKEIAAQFVKTTPEEMESAAVPPELRDFCIDKYMEFLACRRIHFPLNYKCKHEIHAYHDCQFEDHELRMKEYERERRLDKIFAKKNEEQMEQ